MPSAVAIPPAIDDHSPCQVRTFVRHARRAVQGTFGANPLISGRCESNFFARQRAQLCCVSSLSDATAGPLLSADDAAHGSDRIMHRSYLRLPRSFLDKFRKSGALSMHGDITNT